jgi:signal transduction histidine kinase
MTERHRETAGPTGGSERPRSPLTDRGDDGRGRQDRFRALLWANQAIIKDLALESVLQRIVEAACELVRAPYGALGVIAPGGQGLGRFIQVGMDEDVVAAIGRMPEGKGILGALIEDPHPIRLRDLREDPRSVGFPEGHPPMRGFLGVPIRVRDEVFGNLYLASLSEGEFSAEDGELVSALAATAGAAIDNARMYEEAQHRQAWLAASTEVTRQLLSPDGDDDLEQIGSRIAELAGADVVAVVLPSSAAGELEVAVAVGRAAGRLRGMTYPAEGTVSESVLATGRAEILADASDAGADRRVVRLADVVPVGPVMALPLAGSEGIRGVLLAGRLHDGPAFTDIDVEMATGFASQASLALELADARRVAQRMALLDDRARIARDLHDHVIQQLFASGMTLQAALAAPGGEQVAGMIEQVVDSIDDAIGQIRTSIFQLRPQRIRGHELRQSVLAVTTELAPTLHHDPRVHFSGPVDSVPDPVLAEEATAVVRELLTNTARHARASRTEVEVSVSGGVLAVCVSDDGVGMDDGDRRSGLANLGRRARERAGTFAVGPGEAGRGTRARWEVPAR